MEYQSAEQIPNLILILDRTATLVQLRLCGIFFIWKIEYFHSLYNHFLNPNNMPLDFTYFFTVTLMTHTDFY